MKKDMEKKRKAITILLAAAEKEKDAHKQRVLFEAAQKIGGKRR